MTAWADDIRCILQDEKIIYCLNKFPKVTFGDVDSSWEMISSLTCWFSRLLLGDNPGQRFSVTMSLIAIATAAFLAAVQQGEVVLGLLDQQVSNALTVTYVGGLMLFYGLIRSGISRRLSVDIGLLLPQAVFGIACLAWSYAIHGQTRGAVLMIVLFVIVYGMLSLTPRQAAGLGVFALAALSAGVAFKAFYHPEDFEPRVELIHFGLFGATLAGASLVSVRVNAMRQRLTQQKRALEEALSNLSHLATRDGLTGLLNRRALLERLRTEVACRDPGTSILTLAIIDLDHFKRVNDEHGHQAGDAVLCSFAALAQAAVRGSDLLARWGGEEFMLALPDTTPAEALMVLERLRNNLSACSSELVAPGPAVTFSAGVSECACVADIESCIGRADQALYRAKHDGRNRSVIGAVPSRSADLVCA